MSKPLSHLLLAPIVLILGCPPSGPKQWSGSACSVSGAVRFIDVAGVSRSLTMKCTACFDDAAAPEYRILVGGTAQVECKGVTAGNLDPDGVAPNNSIIVGFFDSTNAPKRVGLVGGGERLQYRDQSGAIHQNEGNFEIDSISQSHDGISLSIDLNPKAVQTDSGVVQSRGVEFVEVGRLTGSFSAITGDTGGGGAGSSCADDGASCAQDSRVTGYNAECEQENNNEANGDIGACNCAAAATSQCFIDHGCYKEAGANTSMTRSQLEQDRDRAKQNAQDVNRTCTL